MAVSRFPSFVNVRSHSIRYLRQMPTTAAAMLRASEVPFRQQEGRSWVEAISRHRDAAVTHWGNDCGDDEGNRLAAALGARCPCRRGAQAPQAEARVEEGGRPADLPDRPDSGKSGVRQSKRRSS